MGWYYFPLYCHRSGVLLHGSAHGKLGRYTRGRKFIHIDIDPSQIGRVIPIDVGIVSDAKAALTALLEEAKRRGYKPEMGERVKNLPKRRAELARKTDYDNFSIKP